MSEIRATFRIRASLAIRDGICLIYKKGGETVSPQEIADTVCEQIELWKSCWACDVEDIQIVPEGHNIQELFASIPDVNKFYIGR